MLSRASRPRFRSPGDGYPTASESSRLNPGCSGTQVSTWRTTAEADVPSYSSTADGFDYDTLTDDLEAVLNEVHLTDVTLVGFSMGGGEVARYVTRHGEDRLHSVVLAAAVPP